MEVISVCPLPTSSLLWRSARDRWVLTVVVKGTFTLRPQRSSLAADQEDINEREDHWDDDPARSLHAPSDLAPFKKRADVVLVGHAFVPQDKPPRSVIARMRIGDLEKVIDVYGQRFWTRSGELREGPPMARIPLRYEHAAGGPDTWNPVGLSPDAPPDLFGQRLLPNLQPPGLELNSPRDMIRPVGFGPIAASWLLRRQWLRGRADTWTTDRLADEPLPDDIDPLFFQVAPPDQQVEAISDEEDILLENLHPKHPRLATHLSGVRPRASVELPPAPADLPLVADTLWIDTDRSLCTVTWRGQLSLARPDQPGRVVVTIGAAMTTLAEMKSNDITAVLPTDRVSSPSLPFSRPVEGQGPIPASIPTDPSSRPLRRGPRNTVEVAVPENFAAVPPWLAAQRAVASAASPEPALPVVPSLLASPSPVLAAMPERVSLGETMGASQAAYIGALAASNAAAGATAAASPAAPPAGKPSAREEAPAAVSLELLWHDPAYLAKIRKVAVWKPLLKPPTKKPAAQRGAPPPPPEPPEALEDAARVDLMAILVKGAPSTAGTLDDLLARALGEDGAAALTLVTGELDFPLDEVALLEATVGAATPLAAADKKLKETLDLAADLLKTPLEGAPEVVESLLARIREAWGRANRMLPATHLETYPERLLLKQRRYQKRDVLDDTWIRALFMPAGLPAYLPASLAKRLPLFKRFSSRAIVEVVPQQDQYESSHLALRMVALGRVVSLPSRPASQ